MSKPSKLPAPPPAPSKGVRAFIWAHGAANEYSAKGQYEEVVLPGAEIADVEFAENRFNLPADRAQVTPQGTIRVSGVLSGNSVKVIGRNREFVEGIAPRPRPVEQTYAENNESFDVAVAYRSAVRMSDMWEKFFGKGSYAALVSYKSGKKWLPVLVNDDQSNNAHYSKHTESVHLGTNGGHFDFAQDSDVVVHEKTHHVIDQILPDMNKTQDAGAISEGVSDASAALVHRDPEVGEDQCKVDSSTCNGAGKRSALNQKRISDRDNEPHEAGKVYSGFAWAVGEYLHTLFRGKARNQRRDAEALDGDAADEALKILWSSIYYWGSRATTRWDFVAGYKLAVERLRSAGNLDPRIDVKALLAFVDAEAEKRGLGAPKQGAPVRNGQIVALKASDQKSAIREALQKAGFPTLQYLVTKQYGEVRKGPGGEELRRYHVAWEMDYAGRGLPVQLEDEFLTIVRNPDGHYFAQLGLLPILAGDIREARPAFGMQNRAFVSAEAKPLKLDASARLIPLEVTTPAFKHLDVSVRNDVRAWVNCKDVKAKEVCALMRLAQMRLNKGAFKRGFELRTGILHVFLDLGCVRYYAPVMSDGTIATVERDADVEFPEVKKH